MPFIGVCIDGRHLRIGAPYRFRIAALIQFVARRQARFGRGGGDEFDTPREATDERFSAPSPDDVAEHAMCFGEPVWTALWTQELR